MEVAQTTLEHAQENLAAFESQLFSPELWNRIGALIRAISDRYLEAAIWIALMMEKAYNFENDTKLKIISQQYAMQRASLESLTEGILAGDALLAKIDGTLSGTFEGAGVASSWELELPVRSNDLNHGLISDVRVTLYYEALYDAQLDQSVRRRPIPKEDLQRNICFLLRPRFPDQYLPFRSKERSSGSC